MKVTRDDDWRNGKKFEFEATPLELVKVALDQWGLNETRCLAEMIARLIEVQDPRRWIALSGARVTPIDETEPLTALHNQLFLLFNEAGFKRTDFTIAYRKFGEAAYLLGRKHEREGL